LTMGQVAGEFRTKLAIEQRRNLSPAYIEPGYANYVN